MSDLELTEFGFKYGPVEVQRLCSDRRAGYTIGVTTAKDALQVRVTKMGLIRVFSVKHGELHPKQVHTLKRRSADA